MENQATNKKSGVGFVISWIIIGIILGAGGYYLTSGNFGMKKPVQDSINKIAEAQQKDIVDKVGKLIILPTDEIPAIFIINDAKALSKDQLFYKDAVNNDIVLVYQKTQKAIIYSPSRNIVVNVGPIVLQNNPTTAATTTETKKK